MASKAATPSIILLSLNLLFFTCVTSTYVPCPPIPTKPHPKPYHKPPHKYPPVYPLCPSDTLKLGVCANVLNLVNVVIGGPSTLPCCALLEGLADLEAAVCLCTAIKANILGLNLNIPISLSLVLDSCSKNVPAGFQCA